MKLDTWKVLACKLLAIVGVLFLFGLVGAVIEGSCPWLPALVLGALCLVFLNSLCGALLPAVEEAVPAAEPAGAAEPVRLQVIDGGRVA